jgi:hypothetical protein
MSATVRSEILEQSIITTRERVFRLVLQAAKNVDAESLGFGTARQILKEDATARTGRFYILCRRDFEILGVRDLNPRFEFHKGRQLFIGIHNELFDPMERVTGVLLFAGCAPNRRCLPCRYEFVNYCSSVPATNY